MIKSQYLQSVLVCFLLACCAMPSAAQTTVRSELLGKPEKTSISVKIMFADSVDVYAEYGTVSGTYTAQTSPQTAADSTMTEIVMNGLQPDTKYYYRLKYRYAGSGAYTARPEYSFHTARSAGTSFTFVVQADPHLDVQSDTEVYARCLQNQLDDQPDFMIDLGDFLMTDKLRNPSNVVPYDTIPYRCNLLSSFYEKVCHSLPLFIALGNHEGESGWNLNASPNNIAVWGTQERKKFYLNPFPDTFYSGDTTHFTYVGQRAACYAWTWGDALFIVLDPYWFTTTKPDSLHGWRWTLGKTQYDWLKSTLENSTAKFKFVFSHHLIGGDPDGRGGVEFANRYEWGGDNLDGSPGFAANRPGWYKPIKDLLTENRVTIFFHGHDHFFGKQEKDCLIYQECPQPSHPNFTSVSYATDYGYVQGQILPNSGHIRVKLDTSGVKVDYVRVYKAADETPTRHNKDISATYFIGNINCYDSIATSTPVLWNGNYADELIYPNPFSTSTRIEFSLKHTERIYLSIYNETGQVIKHLITGSEVQAGTFQVIWDGTNAAGAQQPDGIYYYKINGESGYTASGKIMFIH